MQTIAKAISIIYHPLLILMHGLLLLLVVNPYLFGVHSIFDKDGLILIVFFSTVLIPAVAIGIMYRLELISSLNMPRRSDRYGPLMAVGLFYGWLLINFRHNPDIPKAYTTFVLGTVIALVLAFLINLFYKLSLHGMGVGGLIAMVLITWGDYAWGNTFPIYLDGETYDIHTGFLLAFAIFIAGLTGSCRLYLKAHTPDEWYVGFGVGILSLFSAYLWMNYI